MWYRQGQLVSSCPWIQGKLLKWTEFFFSGNSVRQCHQFSAVCDQFRSVRWTPFKNSTIWWYLLWVKTFAFSAKLAMKSPICCWCISNIVAEQLPQWPRLESAGNSEMRLLTSIHASALSLGIPTLSRSMPESRKFRLDMEHMLRADICTGASAGMGSHTGYIHTDTRSSLLSQCVV